MTPYYSDDHVTIYHADCLDIIDDLTFDVIVTDPPYGMSYVSNFGRTPTEPITGDGSTAARDTVLARAAVPALVFGRWSCARPEAVRQRLVWDKGASPGMGDLTIPWGPADEEIYVIGDGFIGKRRPNVLRVPGLAAGDAQRPAHPTPKPIPLMSMLIQACPEDWMILDPFMGSGTTLRAAKDLGRKAIGIEIDERYCEIAARRMGQEVLF